MRVVSDICSCGGAVVLWCPPLKRDASLPLCTWAPPVLRGGPVFWEQSEHCLGRLRDPTSMPTFQLQAEMFLALHDTMIPLLLQLRPCRWWLWISGLPQYSGPSPLAVGWLTTTPWYVISGLGIQDIGLGCISPAL